MYDPIKNVAMRVRFSAVPTDRALNSDTNSISSADEDVIKGTQIKILDLQDLSGLADARSLSSNTDDFRPTMGLSVQFTERCGVEGWSPGLLTAD